MLQLLLIAIAPVMIIICYIYAKDKFEKEPWSLLFKNFLLGASISVVLTLGITYVSSNLLPELTQNRLLFAFIQAFVMVALVEEFSKYFIVRIYAQKHAEFNEPFDGIVYAVMVSMGFAATENILYVFQYGVNTGIVRAFTAVPAHATFGILMGYFMGIAKFSNHKRLFNLLGLFLAVLFHGAYDFFLFLDFVPGIWIGAFVSLIIALMLSKKAIRKHQENSQFNI